MVIHWVWGVVVGGQDVRIKTQGRADDRLARDLRLYAEVVRSRSWMRAVLRPFEAEIRWRQHCAAPCSVGLRGVSPRTGPNGTHAIVRAQDQYRYTAPA